MLSHRSRSPLSWSARIAALAALSLLVFGCGRNPVDSGTTVAPAPEPVIEANDPEVLAAIAVQERHTPELMAVDRVVGTAVGLDAQGKVVIQVFAEAEDVSNVPHELDGIGVERVVTGPITAFKGMTVAVSHTAIQAPPIQLGTSGGPALDANGSACCAGTLGGLVQRAGAQYILSNSHVLAGDVNAGGNGRVSTLGDDVTQPGLVHVGCQPSQAQAVADLSSLSTLDPAPGSPNVDCAIAEVRPGMVMSDGSILEIGPPSSATLAAALNQSVKKSGAATRVTRSKVSALNATVTVNYTDECGGTVFSKTFTGQLVVANKGTKFFVPGDSGSLLLENVTTSPRAIGLLFAGSGSTAFANPIEDVLTHLGATMVGN